MTALPKRKVSHHRQGKRRASIKVAIPKLIACSNCGQPRATHRVCLSCGFYNQTSVIKPRQ